MSDPQYKPGDCRAEHLGEIRLADGRVFRGVILTFPSDPPNLPFSIVWDGTPLRLSMRDEG